MTERKAIAAAGRTWSRFRLPGAPGPSEAVAAVKASGVTALPVFYMVLSVADGWPNGECLHPMRP
jgi:hypothetical protein